MRTALPAVLALAAFAGPAGAQFDTRRRAEGTEAFRQVIGALGLKPPPEGRDWLSEPPDTILIVFGRTDEALDRLQPGTLKEFMRNGGAVLIATDRQTSDALYWEIGVRVSGEIITTLPGPGRAYRGTMTECPLVWEFGRQAGHPQPPSNFLFQGMGNEPVVASNLPSEIDPSRYREIVPLAFFAAPGHEIDPVGPGGFRLPFGSRKNHALFAVAGFPETKRRLLVMADHSVFTNQMMLQADNDNVLFAFNTLRWLADAGGGRRRSQVAFFDDGYPQTDFNPPLVLPQPQLSLEQLVPLADQAIVGLERENAFNRMLLEAAGGLWPVLRTVTFLLTMALLLFGLYRFLQARYRPESRPPAAAVAARDAPAVERRRQAVIETGNLSETARELSYQAFASLGLTPAPDSPPPAVLSGRGWSREIRRLWNLAARGPSRRVSPARLRRIDAALRNLLDAVAAGHVRLASGPSPI